MSEREYPQITPLCGRDYFAERKAAREAKRCAQCGRDMNPVAIMLGPICGECCRENHKEATR